MLFSVVLVGRKRLFDVESLLAPEAKSAAENNNKLLSPPLSSSHYGQVHKRLRMSEDGLREGSSQDKDEDEDEDVRINVDSDDEDLDVDVSGDEREDGKKNEGVRRRNESGTHTPKSNRDVEARSPSSSPGVYNTSRVTAVSDRSPARSSSASEGDAEGRGPFTSPLPERPGDISASRTPLGHPVVLHPSAFRANAPAAGGIPPATATAWSSLPPHGYPISYPGMPSSSTAGLSPAEAAAAAQRWQEAFSRIVARSYESAQNLKLEV